MDQQFRILDLSITLTPPELGVQPDALANITLECEMLGLSHTGEMLLDVLTQREQNDLHWYLEEYWKWPYLEFAMRGKKVEALLIEVGKRLYQAAFGSVEAQTLLHAWQQQPNVQHQISIVSELPSALSLLWELLHNQQDFLVLHPDHPISIVRRFSKPEQSAHLNPFEPPLRILLITARPADAGFIDPRSLARELLDEVQQHINAGTIELEFLRPPTQIALRTRLQKIQQPLYILHFDGHGIFNEQKQQGMLAFEDNKNRPDPVTATELAQILQNSSVQLVVLTACQSATSAADNAFSSVAAQLLQGGINGPGTSTASLT